MCIYTGDVAKRLKTYRLDPGECAGFAAAVAETGETETEVLRRAILAYIQRVRTGQDATAAPVAGPPVYTPPERPPTAPQWYEEPAGAPCKHPADRVDELNVCHECDTEID